MKRIIAMVFALNLLGLLMVRSPAMALGVGMAPMELEIQDALRGGEYERVVTVFNPGEVEASYILRAEGPAAGWLSFYDWEDKTPIQDLTIPGATKLHVLVKVNVPPDIPNDTYTASILAETNPDAAGEGGVSTMMRARTVLSIIVTDKEIIAGTVGYINVKDAEAGFPLVIEVSFRNQGNVIVYPRIDCRISKDNLKIDEFSHTETAVKPGSQETIQVEWATRADQTGDYTADVSVIMGQQALSSTQLPFKILPPGSFSTQGELVEFVYQGAAVLDQMAKLLADFKNTGEADMRAKLTVEVSKDGALVDVINSEEVLVTVGETGTLTAYFKPAEKGRYTLNGVVNYAGKQSNEKSLVIDVGGGGGSGGSEGLFGLSWLSWPIIGGAAGAILVIIIIIFLMSKR